MLIRATLLSIAAAQGEFRRRIDDFATPDALSSFGAIEPRGGGRDPLRLDYDARLPDGGVGRPLEGTRAGLVAVGRVAPKPFGCAAAEGLALSYRVAVPSVRLAAVRLVIVLVDGSDCVGDACARWPGFANGHYTYHSSPALLDDASGVWRELRLGLCGDASPRSPFFRMGGWGARGDGPLDAAALRGYWVGVRSNVAEASAGSIELGELSCVSAPEACATAPRGAALVEGARFSAAAALREDKWGHQVCNELCAAEPACAYYATDVRYDGAARRYPTCRLYSSLAATDLEPASAEDEAWWVTESQRRGRLCSVCECDADVANCSGVDLATVPDGSGAGVEVVDLSRNPRLVLVGSGAFDGLRSLRRVVLPAGLAHVTPAVLRGLPARAVADVAPGPRDPRAFIFRPTDAFDDKCCGRGEVVAGVTFCDLTPDAPGAVDATYKTVDLATYGRLFAGRRPSETITSDSPFLAEAAESVEKCGAYCAMDAACRAFAGGIDGRERVCEHWAAAPAGFERAPAAPGGTPTRTVGLPPRERAARNATVVASPKEVALSEATDFAATFELRLGAPPLRGGVRVTPVLAASTADVAGLDAVFDPPSVAFYDAATTVTVAVTVAEPDRDLTPTVDLVVDACDAAFRDATLQLDVRAPRDSNDRQRRRNRRNRAALVISIGVFVSVVGCLALAWLALRIRKYAKRKLKLEEDRAALVQEQVYAAQKQVAEFQGHYYVLPGDAFVELGRLKAHEDCRDLLKVYDSVEDVGHAMEAGDVFCFISHQWLGWAEPDPKGVHYKAMAHAVRAVADDARVPLERVRVWVDVSSIPQRNFAAQKMAIASLPTFASTANYFVVVCPDVVHADTGCLCNSRSYRSRAWCRAEIMSCWARNGTENMFVSTPKGLRPLAATDEVLTEALNVFGGELTCCRRGHPNGEACDLEHLMLPMLGLYAELYRDRHGVAAEAYSVLEPVKDTFYPKKMTVCYKCQDEGETTTETHELFGDLIEAVEYSVALAESKPDSAIWTRRLPDLAPGTSGQRRRGRFSKSKSDSLGQSEARTMAHVPHRAEKLMLRKLTTQMSTEHAPHRAYSRGQLRRHGSQSPEQEEDSVSRRTAASTDDDSTTRSVRPSHAAPHGNLRGLFARAGSSWRTSFGSLKGDGATATEPPGDHP